MRLAVITETFPPEINGVAIPFALDDLSHTYPATDIVVANILAPVLIQFAAQVAGSVAQGPQSRLVVSGILDEQYAAVRARNILRKLEERGVGQFSHAQVRQPRLPRAEKLARPAQLQVFVRQFEPVLGGLYDIEP